MNPATSVLIAYSVVALLLWGYLALLATRRRRQRALRQAAEPKQPSYP